MSTLLGQWGINWDRFGSQFRCRSLDELVLTIPPRVASLSAAGAVDDFSATVDELRQSCPPYLRIVPFGQPEDVISPVIDDGDILVFVRAVQDVSNPAEILKQRGWHAEICYKDEAGRAFQKAPWGGSPTDAPCNDAKHDWIMHILRLEVPGVDPDRVLALKRQVRSWKVIFNNYDFPKDGNPETGGHWFLDPADFSSVPEVEGLGKAIVGRPEGTKPNVAPVTCVQWAYTVLCLALNVPLSRSNLARLGVHDDFCRYWASEVGWAHDGVAGLGFLPFAPYSPAEVLQVFLDTYMPGQSLLTLLGQPGAKEFLRTTLESQKHPGLPERVAGYLEEITTSGDISKSLRVGPREYRFVMPISFFCEARNPPTDSSASWFRYVGTAVHSSFLVPL